MDNSLKLNLKKELFEQVTVDNVSSLSFEATPYYFGRFTTGKWNSIEDVRNNPDLFKSYDNVLVSCSGETVELSFGGVTLTEGDNPEFVLSFVKNDETVETPTHVEEPISETVSEEVVTETDEVVEEPKTLSTEETTEEEIKHVIEENTEVEDTTDIKTNDEVTTIEFVKRVLTDFFNKKNVYVVNTTNVRIGNMGKIWGSKKTFPSKNEHDQVVILEPVEFKIDTLETELEKFGGYVFASPSSLKIEDDKIIIYLKQVSVLEVLNNWI